MQYPTFIVVIGTSEIVLLKEVVFILYNLIFHLILNNSKRVAVGAEMTT